MMRSRRSFVVLCTAVSLVMGASLVTAQQPRMSAEQAEELGIDGPPVASTDPNTVPGERTTEGVAQLPDFLLIPDSDNDRVMSFDPTTGDLLDADFIPADPTHLSTPIAAILSPTNDSILVSDQIEDVVYEYDLDGNYVGYYAPATGPDTSIADNLRGIALRPGGNLLVTVASGANSDAVAEFDTAGAYVGNFIANAAGGLDGPFDIHFRASDVLVPASTSDAVHRYDTSGSYLSDLVPSVNFPEQVAEASNGNLLVAGFSSPSGVHEYQSDGTFVATYDVVTGVRGVFELADGNLLVTNGSGVHEITRSNTLVDTKIAVSGRFISLISGAVPVELQTFGVE